MFVYHKLKVVHGSIWFNSNLEVGRNMDLQCAKLLFLLCVYLVCTGLLQPVHHGLKLYGLDLHLAVEPVEEGLVLGVHVVVRLLIVQAQG